MKPYIVISKCRLLLATMVTLCSAVTGHAENDFGNQRRYAEDNARVRQLPQEQRRVVFIGNSITDSWINIRPDFFSQNGYIDRGIFGQTSYQFVVRYRAITEGNAVELGKLGRFTPTISSEGALPGVDKDGNPKTAMEMFTEDNIKQVNVCFELGEGLNFKREDFDFEYTTTRKAQAAAKKAQKKGEESADWSDPDDEGNEG